MQLAAEVVQTYADVRDQQARLALVDASVEIEEQACNWISGRAFRIAAGSANGTWLGIAGRARGVLRLASNSLDAERTRYQAQESRISGDALLLKDFASLHKALGLGWTL